jgi:hypothetical protein
MFRYNISAVVYHSKVTHGPRRRRPSPLPITGKIMPTLDLKQAQKIQTKQISRLIGRMKLSNFIELSERDFTEFVKRVEENPLFIRLTYSRNKEEKVISYKRFNRMGISRYFYELREEAVPARYSFNLTPLLVNRRGVISLIKKLGMDKFKRYFLYNEKEMAPEDIAIECNIDISDVKRINNLIDEMSIHSEFYTPSVIIKGEKIHYSKIASIEKSDDGSYYIGYFSSSLVRGRYLINYEKIWNLKKNNAFSREELKRLDKLLRDLELINKRKTTTHQIIENILRVQLHYFKSGDPLDLVAFSQSELAQRMETDPSLVSRGISGRSIETPWQEEKPLKYFFPSNKEVRKNLIRKIVMEEKEPESDEEIRSVLKERFNITISRRAVRNCRKELGISHSWKRKRDKRPNI